MTAPDAATISPFFARDAAEHMRRGDIRGALDLCVAGTKAFPNYATGHLVLAKCYDAFGKTTEALTEFRQALNILPDNPTLRVLVKAAEEKEQREFRAQVEDQERRFEAANAAPPKAPVPATPAMTTAREETTEEYLENIVKRLQERKATKPASPPAAEPSPMPPEGTRSEQFVTATMAEIFATQGEFVPAMNAYRELMKHHPEEHQKYAARIAELERLHARQQQEKQADPPKNKKAS
jgi:tetratricopeptide (TPR) repeat protein